LLCAPQQQRAAWRKKKGGMDLTGSYDMVVGWFEPGIDGWNQRVVSVNTEDPNRVFIADFNNRLL
jgi:hypothetical protein